MSNIEKIRYRLITSDKTLMDALKLMDKAAYKSLLVVDNLDLFSGIISIGDIQRAIIRNMSLDTRISDILRSNPKVALEDTSVQEIKDLMLEFRMEFIPVLDSTNRIIDVYLWEELFVKKNIPPKKQFNLPVIIMAGGVGSRLKPLTNVLPKPLIPIGEKTIIEEIFGRFGMYGCSNFYISVNYKAELIEYYLKNQNLPYQLSFFKEDKPMGTAGSLYLLNGRLNQTFFVSNCDILIEQDYSEILDYHKENKNEITIVTALKNYPIPYGTIETGENGQLLELIEKPEITFKINSGMYILEPNLLEEIPINQFFHITHLIEKVKARNGRIGAFPVSEKSWKDIGTWDEYKSKLV